MLPSLLLSLAFLATLSTAAAAHVALQRPQYLEAVRPVLPNNNNGEPLDLELQQVEGGVAAQQQVVQQVPEMVSSAPGEGTTYPPH